MSNYHHLLFNNGTSASASIFTMSTQNDSRYFAESQAKIHFDTGLVEARQTTKGDDTGYRTFIAIYYR